MPLALRLEHLTKRLGSVLALDDVSLEIDLDEVLALADRILGRMMLGQRQDDAPSGAESAHG